MGSGKRVKKSRVEKIKKSISAKLLTGGACFVLSTNAAVGQVPEDRTQQIAGQDVMQRLEKLRNNSNDPTSSGSRESLKGTDRVTWYNWDKWNKGEWQDTPWYNY